MFFEQLFKTVRIAIILTFAFAVFYYLFLYNDGRPKVVYRVPVEKQEAAARTYNEVYSKNFNGVNQNSAAQAAEDAVSKIYGEPVFIQQGEATTDPLSFIKSEKKPTSRLSK